MPFFPFPTSVNILCRSSEQDRRLFLSPQVIHGAEKDSPDTPKGAAPGFPEQLLLYQSCYDQVLLNGFFFFLVYWRTM